MLDARYQPRLVDRLLIDLFGELPALAITGPRATGKTTTAARLAGRPAGLPARSGTGIAAP